MVLDSGSECNVPKGLWVRPNLPNIFIPNLFVYPKKNFPNFFFLPKFFFFFNFFFSSKFLLFFTQIFFLPKIFFPNFFFSQIIIYFIMPNSPNSHKEKENVAIYLSICQVELPHTLMLTRKS